MFINFLSKNILTTERKNSFGFWLAIFLLLVAIDQLTKLIAQNYLDVFKNYNFAFSLSLPSQVMFAVYIVVMVLIVRYIKQTWNNSQARIRFAWLLILAGGLSNILERIILGYVRDFIPLLSGMLNIADFMIIFGALLILTKRIPRQ